MSGGVSRSACPIARSVTRSATAIRSAGPANRTPCSWRSASAYTLGRVNVARCPATTAEREPATSVSISSARPVGPQRRHRSSRSASPATHSVCSGRRRTGRPAPATPRPARPAA